MPTLLSEKRATTASLLTPGVGGLAQQVLTHGILIIRAAMFLLLVLVSSDWRCVSMVRLLVNSRLAISPLVRPSASRVRTCCSRPDKSWGSRAVLVSDCHKTCFRSARPSGLSRKRLPAATAQIATTSSSRLALLST